MADWIRWCNTAGWAVDDECVTVALAEGRKHVVRCQEQAHVLELSATVAKAHRLPPGDQIARWIWMRNRRVQRVGFRLDHRGHLVGDSWLPRAGLTAEEFRETVRHLAAECDRMELLLTGVDVE